MAVFKFDQVDEYVQGNNSDNKINFLKLQDDGWYAKVRFMYGPGEIFEGISVHNVSQDPQKPKFVPCLRELNQPLEVCPLCNSGSKVIAQYFLYVYVISIVSNIRGVTQEQPVNQVYIFQRGKTFKGILDSILRQCAGTPIVNNIFNIVRSGKAGDQQTKYLVEFVGRDEIDINSLPPKPQILGSYILPQVDYNTMLEKYVNKQPDVVTPRNNNIIPNNTSNGYGVPTQAPNITSF